MTKIYLMIIVCFILFNTSIKQAFASIEIGRRISINAVEEINKGKTTKNDISNLFGRPSYIRSRKKYNEVIWIYEYTIEHATSTAWIPIVNFFTAPSIARCEILVIIFNKNIVENYKYRRFKFTLKYGNNHIIGHAEIHGKENIRIYINNLH